MDEWLFMVNTKPKRFRLSINVDPEKHLKIKISTVAYNGVQYKKVIVIQTILRSNLCVVMEDCGVELRDFDPERVRYTSPGQQHPGIKTQKKDSPVRA